MPEIKYSSLEEKAKFEELLLHDEKKITFAQALRELKSKTRVGLIHLVKIQEPIGNLSRLNDMHVIAVYQDGAALTKEEIKTNFTEHHYYLHKHDASVIYKLDSIFIRDRES
jgi:hypothetical protein